MALCRTRKRLGAPVEPRVCTYTAGRRGRGRKRGKVCGARGGVPSIRRRIGGACRANEIHRSTQLTNCPAASPFASVLLPPLPPPPSPFPPPPPRVPTLIRSHVGEEAARIPSNFATRSRTSARVSRLAIARAPCRGRKCRGYAG